MNKLKKYNTTQIAGFIFFIFLLSCNKVKERITIPGFIDKYLTCDSIKTSMNGNDKIIVKGRGTGLDITFRSNSYTLYSTPPQEFRYKVRYSKLYFWKENTNTREGDFYNILYSKDKKLVLQYENYDTNEVTTYYYSAD